MLLVGSQSFIMTKSPGIFSGLFGIVSQNRIRLPAINVVSLPYTSLMSSSNGTVRLQLNLPRVRRLMTASGDSISTHGRFLQIRSQDTWKSTIPRICDGSRWSSAKVKIWNGSSWS